MMKPLILIVEDEAPLVTMLRYNLEREGFAVDAATDGEEALLRIAEHRPDAVLLDDEVVDPSSFQLVAHRKAGLASTDDEDAPVIAIACSSHVRIL